MSIDGFLLEAVYSFLIIKNLSSASKLESWWTKPDKVRMVLRCVYIPICLSWKLHIWSCYQGLSWWWCIFKCLSDGIIQNFVPYIGILMCWTWEKCPNSILILSIFGRINIRSSRFEFFRQCLYRDVRSLTLGYFQKWFVVCSLSFPMHHVDGKCRSATALFVYFWRVLKL